MGTSPAPASLAPAVLTTCTLHESTSGLQIQIYWHCMLTEWWVLIRKVISMNTVTNRKAIRAIARYLVAMVGREEARLQVPFALAVRHTFQKSLHSRLSGKNL